MGWQHLLTTHLVPYTLHILLHKRERRLQAFPAVQCMPSPEKERHLGFQAGQNRLLLLGRRERRQQSAVWAGQWAAGR